MVKNFLHRHGRWTLFWKYPAVLVGGLALMAIGLGVAYELDLEWLRVVALTLPIALVGIAAMLIKRQHQRAGRTDALDSIERERDVRARAGAYVLALVSTAVALAVGVLVPGIASWVIVAALLAVIIAGYGVCRLWVKRDDRQ